MKQSILFSFSILSCILLSAQDVQWTWISGDSTGNNIDVYGNRRMLDSVNKPGAVAPANTWIDKAGNLYMFGGQTLIIRFGFDTIPVFTTALWKYSPVKNAWAMITGANGTNPALSGGGGVFGTPGVPAPNNTPEMLEYASTTWTDTSGNWWMFGGKTGFRDFGTKSYVWKFDPLIGQWTFIRNDKDDSYPSYGTKGIASPLNTPGARTGMITWTDRDGQLYFYGGFLRYGGYSLYGDVWKYDPIANLWTWVSGRQWYRGIVDKPVYGTKEVFAPDNTPGTEPVGDQSLGEADANGNISMMISNETWRYSVKTNQWAWISGDRTIKPDPVPKRNYGSKGVPSAGNHPGTRAGAVSWTDSIGNRWLFGGSYADASSKPVYLNDLWKYTLQTGEWTWVGGDSSINRPADYGIKGTPAPTNQPGGRTSSVIWKDAQGNVWLFGGMRQTQRSFVSTSPIYSNKLNDLWKLHIKSTPAPTKPGGFSAMLRDPQVVLQWNTAQEYNTREFIIERSADSIQFTVIGTVAAGNASAVSHYQFTDNAPLSGNNFYRLKQVNLNNSFAYSALVKIAIEIDGFTYRILQNPVQQELKIAFKADQLATVQVRISNASGHLLISNNIQVAQGMSTYTIPVGQLASGLYFVSIMKDKKTITKRFYK